MERSIWVLASLAALVSSGFACTAGPSRSERSEGGTGASGSSLDPNGSGGGSGSGSGGEQGANDLVVDPTMSNMGGAGVFVPTVDIITTLPEGFSIADPESPETSRGGTRVVGPLEDVPLPEGECKNVLRILVRDFETSHDDFEHVSDSGYYDVLSPIGPSRKPEKTSTSGPLHMEEWYQNIEGTNIPFAVDLWLEPENGSFVYDSSAFFPIDDVGYKDRYLFTTELHTRFEYQGGEVFTFRGDDDVFVYVNGHLGLNLSGVHTPQTGTIVMDDIAAEYGMQIGNVYTFDLFQAERQPTGSNFRMETTLDFTGCGEILPTDIIVR